MPRLVLHIGTHKTGTTAFQEACHAHRADLARQRVIYPDAGRHSGHHSYLTDWISLPQAYVSAAGGLAGLRRLADDWRDSDATLLLSSEEFSRAGGRGGRVDFALLREVFAGYSMLVVCVLRIQWQFIQAVYLELSRTTPPPPPAALVAEALSTGQVDGLWCDYAALYQGLRESFSPDEILMLDYTQLCAAPEGVVGGILKAANATGTDESPDWARARTRVNASPAALPTWAAHVVAGGRTPGSDLRHVAQEAFDLEYGAGRSGVLLSREETAGIDAHFRGPNETLANLVAGQQPGWELSTPSPDATALHREDIRDGYWIRLARRLDLRQRGAPISAHCKARTGGKE